ncbi:MAG: amine dehydrogenase large subunit [Phenylobacterium sp.]|uniref:amine dehydrogenase large subunit n=1 Tax=Phenylobacterium sp. TaxID=1871053 RepID=UPI00391C61AD
MSGRWGAAYGVIAALISSTVLAQEPIAPEELKVEQAIKPGPNVYVTSPSWAGAGAISIFSADDLSYKGNYATGMTGQFALGAKGDVGYSASAFPKRITYGPIEAVLQTFDISTLKTTQEIEIPAKFAQTAAMQGALQVTPDGGRAYVQNATPATSVSIIDLKSGAVTAEAPIPGCWTIIPAEDGSGFSSLCGDGTMLTVKVGADGKPTGQAYSDKIFDVEKDPLFVHSQRVKGDLYFLSYKGVLYRVSDKGPAAKLVETIPIAAGAPGDWAPGGYEVMSYSAPYGVMFVLMHSGAKDGSHKNPSEEIWAVDLAKKTVLYRSVAKGLTHVAVTQGKAPLVFGVNGHEGGLFRFEVDPTAKFAAKLTHQIELREAGYVVAP